VTSLDKPTEETQQPEQDSRAATEAALGEAFGGVRGMIETVVPGLLFVAIYTVNKDLHISAIAALAVSLLMGVVRLVRKDTVKHAFSGVFGVAFGVVFAMMTGNAKDFYLPGMIYTLGLALAYLVSTALGFPLMGVILGPLFKENLSWRKRNPGRKKAYAKASVAWGLILLAKCAILFPLYWWADTTQLGWVLISLKIPPFLLAVWLTWVFLAKAPAPIDVFAEMEERERAEAAAAEAAEGGATAGDAVAPAPEQGGRHRRDG
jgi:vacuolar-type H+-ATPase subunit I/STV1